MPMHDNAVILHLLNAHPDPQYAATKYAETGGHWPADVGLLTVLPTILERSEAQVIVLHDCLDEPDTDRVRFVRVPRYRATNAYFARWECTAWYLLDEGAHHRFVWCVDGGDVTMLRDPFPHMLEGPLYIGSEPNAGPHERHVGFWWCREFHPDHAEWIDANAGRDLLNPGLLGGDVTTVTDFAAGMCQVWPSADGTDVMAANWLAYEKFPDFITGDRIHTRYWYFETNDHSWWSHK